MIANDPRVRRQGDALTAAGHQVLAVGLPEQDSKPPEWPILAIGSAMQAVPRPSLIRTLRRALDIPMQAVRPSYAWSVYWRLNPAYRAMAAIAEAQDVDLWLANDWTALPIVLDIERRKGTPFAYDTHELAIEEYSQNLKWRLGLRPLIAQIERAGMERARFVSCVSEGIADHLHQAYRLLERPHVIRNAPPYRKSRLRPTATPVNVLYHGVVTQGRALEATIASVASWRPEFRLTIRGPAEPTYLEQLKLLASSTGVGDRIVFAPPLPMTELVAGAEAFDVGLFVIKAHSLQNQFVLPNKFFEYAMAGLALCVSDLPEMRRLIDRFPMGSLVGTVEPGAIAAAINSLDRATIDRCKAAALAAARELCWEREAQTLVRLVNAALQIP
ncbi:glycosyltransferase family 4 protein [Boseaceae bacterium BT-24-1]|nr:glycosyltransferase family 4 protein [Boseaceae bacterium BT-24-1]